jgi:LmbE family N-acetylglucosaminyl deacetylase
MRKIALSFLAHPDDAEILCAGTLLRLREQGWTLHIVTATPGDCGTMTQDRWQISAIRSAEARAAAEKLGGEYHCLDERDGFVVYDQPTLRKAAELFRRIAPSLVFTHAPRDYMMDHEMVSMLARAASFIYAAPNISDLPRVEGSAVPHLYYCDPIGGIDPLGQAVTPTTLIDITAQLSRKAELLACHASQRQWLQAHHGMDEYIEAMKRHAAERGNLAGCAAAEAFVQHRGHAYPGNDLLSELFPAAGASSAKAS